MKTPRCAICNDLSERLVAQVDALAGTRDDDARKWQSRTDLTPDEAKVVTDHTLKVHRKHRTLEASVTELAAAAAHTPATESSGGSLEMGHDGGTLTTGALTAPVSDWDEVLRLWNLDPAQFEVVEPVTFKTWDGFAKVQNIESYDEDGNPDVVTQQTVAKRLYSYKAQVQRKTADEGLTDADLEQYRKRIAKRTLSRTPGTGLGPESTLLVNWADWQLFKPEGGGVEATVDRIHQSLEGTLQRLADLRRIGRNITGIAIANNGDPIEGCDSNYANQLSVTGATQRQMLLLAGDLWEEGISALAPEADRLDFVSVLCNHGEWTRRGPGTKPVTDDSDNVGGYLADVMQRIYRGRPGFDHINWHIPDDEMTLFVPLSGVVTAFNHGHKVTGSGANPQAKFESWAKSQTFYNRQYAAVRLWVTAHYHHLALADMGDSWWIQCPSQDGGSKWLQDTKGAHSAPGCLTMVVGEHDRRGWSDLEVV